MVLPADTPVTIPVEEPIVAVPVLLLLHVPPAVASARVTVDPVFTVAVPVIAAGEAFTDKVSFLEQPFASLYVIVVPPAVNADTSPLVVLIEATDDALLDHVPPVMALVSVADVPVHIEEDPVIAAGAWFTVTMALVKQPVAGILYDTEAVPAAIPVTIPEVELAVAIALLLLHHVPLPPTVAVRTV